MQTQSAAGLHPGGQGVCKPVLLEESSSLQPGCPLGFSCLKSISPFELASDCGNDHEDEEIQMPGLHCDSDFD